MNFASTAQKMKFSIKDFFSKCDKNRSLLRIWSTFTEEILNGNLHFLSSVKPRLRSFSLKQHSELYILLVAIED